MPDFPLDVSGQIESFGGTAGLIFADRASKPNIWQWYSSGDVARFWRTGVGDLLSINTSGKVGLGQTDPSWKLHVYSTGNSGIVSDGPAGIQARIGNITNLSSHSPTLFSPKTDDPFPFTHYSSNAFIGKTVNADLSGALRDLETLTKKKYLYYEDLPREEVLDTESEEINRKEKWKEAWRQENASEKEIPLGEAVEEITIEVEDPKEIVSEAITYEFDEDSGTVVQKRKPVYAKKTLSKKRIREGARLDTRTGKFFMRVLASEATADAAAEESRALWQIPQWIKDKAARR